MTDPYHSREEASTALDGLSEAWSTLPDGIQLDLRYVICGIASELARLEVITNRALPTDSANKKL